MKTKVVAYVGKIGAGKTYQMLKKMEQEKSNGHSVGIISFADPIKQFLETELGLLKSGASGQGPVPTGKTREGRGICRTLPAGFNQHLYDSLNRFIMTSLFYIKDRMTYLDVFRCYIDNFNDIWERYCDELIDHIKGCIDASSATYSTHYRRIIQLVGTEFARGMYNEIWVQNLEEKIDRICASGTIQTLFVDDLRFWNEYKAIDALPHPTTIYGVIAADGVRAERRNATLEDIAKADDHASEADVEGILAKIPDTYRIWND
jgi:hypothetical protein